MAPEDDTPVALPRLTPAEAASFSGPACVVVVSSEEERAAAVALTSERVAWIEAPLALAGAPDLKAWRLDVTLTDPGREAAGLYALARAREGAPTRVSMPAIAGVAKAGQVVLALHLPARIIPAQPSAEAVGELETLLDRYLHDPLATAPIEPFHGALTRIIHGASDTLWHRVEATPPPPAHEAESGDQSLEAHLARLVEANAECASCPLQMWCVGYFKSPDAAYDCAHVRRLFSQLEREAQALQADALAADEQESPARSL